MTMTDQPAADEQHPVEEPASPDETSTEAAAPASGDSAPTTPRSTAWIAWTIALALAVIAGVAVMQWRAVAGPAETVDAARDAAVAYVRTLSTWDASEGLEPTYANLVAGATDEFVPEIDEVFGPEQRQALVASDAVSTGTVEDVLTGDAEADGVAVVVVVEQFVVTGPQADPLARTERVVLVRMVDRSGAWLVDELEMLSELQVAEEGQ